MDKLLFYPNSGIKKCASAPDKKMNKEFSPIAHLSYRLKAQIQPTTNNMAQQNKTIKGSELVATNIQMDALRPNAGGGQSAYLRYNNQPFYVQTPVMRMPFGASEYVDATKGTKSYSASLAFDNMDTKPEIKAFHDALQAVGDHLRVLVKQNYKAWGIKNPDSYSNPIKESNKEGYAPTLKLSIRELANAWKDGPNNKKIPDPSKGVHFEPELYDTKGTPINYSEVAIQQAMPRGTLCAACIALTVWTSPMGWGLTARMVNAKIKPSQSMVSIPTTTEADFEEADSSLANLPAEESSESVAVPTEDTTSQNDDSDGDKTPEVTVTLKKTPAEPAVTKKPTIVKKPTVRK